MWIKTGKWTLGMLLITLLVCRDGWARDHENALKVTARVDRTTVELYERLALEVIVEGPARSLPAPAGLQLEGLKIVGGPQSSTQVQMANGAWSSRLSYTYQLRAEKEGSWTIGPIPITFQGRTYQSNSITIQVKKPEAPPAQSGIDSDSNVPNDRQSDLFVWATVSNPEPFVGQPIEITYELFTRIKVVNFEPERIPEFSGFVVEDVELPERPVVTNRTLNGKEYATAVVHRAILYPTTAGDLTLEPFAVKFAVEVRGRDPFDDFFQSPFGPPGRSSLFSQHQQEIRQSNSISLHVRPLPVEGKPESFSGAVGEFELKASAGKTTVQVGEAIVVEATLTGQHGLKLLSIPPAASITQFKTYEPKAGDVVPNPARPGWSMRTVEYIYVPFEQGQFEIPGIEFSYFDPNSSSYKTLRSDPIAVFINPGPSGEGIPVMARDQRGEIRLLGKDIRYIKTSAPIRSHIEPYRTPWFWGSVLFPFPVIPAVVVMSRRRRKMLEDQGYARAIRARGESTRRLANARSLHTNASFRECLDEMAAAFRGYLSDRFNRPPASISPEVIRDALTSYGVGADRIDSVLDIWETLASVRFSPVNPDPDSIARLMDRVSECLDELEKSRWKARTARSCRSDRA